MARLRGPSGAPYIGIRKNYLESRIGREAENRREPLIYASTCRVLIIPGAEREGGGRRLAVDVINYFHIHGGNWYSGGQEKIVKGPFWDILEGGRIYRMV